MQFHLVKGAGQPCDLLQDQAHHLGPVGGGIELGPDRVRPGRDLAQREGGREQLDQDGVADVLGDPARGGADLAVLEQDGGIVLGKALARGSALLGLSQREVAVAIGTSDATVSRVFAGRRGIDPMTKEGELAALLLRVYRSLDALVGGDDRAARAWLRAPNTHLGAAPATLLASVEGLVRVAEYLDAMRGRL